MNKEFAFLTQEQCRLLSEKRWTDRQIGRCCSLLPLQSLEHQTGQRPRTVHSFLGETSRDKLQETSGYFSGTGTTNRWKHSSEPSVQSVMWALLLV